MSDVEPRCPRCKSDRVVAVVESLDAHALSSWDPNDPESFEYEEIPESYFRTPLPAARGLGCQDCGREFASEEAAVLDNSDEDREGEGR